jgi:pSer/pThr/pTyr-binding forkhead associated (FHA) protein
VVEGWLDADTGFRRFCFVNTRDIDIVIGRGDADIAIEHAAISRAHARIESDGEIMTLSDLGSRNGTFIGEAACLPGEVLYFNPDDEIYLGDVKMTVRVVEQEAQWA